MITSEYRGKRIDNGEWIYGALIVFRGEYYIANPICVRTEDGERWLTIPTSKTKVDPSTVGQFTGLKDKNGKEIYEGDIVTGLFNHTDIIGHIVYGSDATFFIERKGLYGIGLNNAEDWLEVVGNIYENPELLQEG